MHSLLILFIKNACHARENLELEDLGKIVSQCHNLIFILTDGIFDSHW